MHRLGWVGSDVVSWGQIILAIGLIVRYGSLWQLGRFYSGTVAVQKRQQLVETGFYRVIRHPAYTGGRLMIVGLSLALNTWIGAVISAIGLWAVYVYRIRWEEALLLQTFGTPYAIYQQKTGRLFPGIW
ncbi:MAG: isoprenylcysteine carboxylmethyltransferase family protein [Firmicutes bacterium]|nr:isoprenylcysteine carboxylmethyltransferase family protein [Bacillota bacterium]